MKAAGALDEVGLRSLNFDGGDADVFHLREEYLAKKDCVQVRLGPY